MVVIWSNGHFTIVPGVPIHVGTGSCGFYTHDHFDEWMEIPE
jgi:hypothetical protein